MTPPKIAVIILNYNQEKETAQCLRTVTRLSYPSYDVLVVDNGSRERVGERLKSSFPKVHWLTLRENVGFSAGCNEGIRWALSRGMDAVLLLNNDADVASDFLEKIAETASSDPKIGIVGAVICREAGHPFLAGMHFDYLSARIRRIAPSTHSTKVPVVSGSCFFVTKECLEKNGLLDERFFIYFEETDFCYRARKNGFGVVYDPRVQVVHQDGSTFGRESAALRYLYTRNRLLFLSKHCPYWVKPWGFFARFAQDMLLAFFCLLKGKGEMFRAIWFGLEDYWKGRFGKGRLDFFFHG